MIEHVPGHVGHTPRPQPHGMLHPVAVSCEPQIKLFQPNRKLHHKQFSLCAQFQGASVEHRPQYGQHSQKLHAAYDADGHMVPFSLYRNPHPVGQEPGRRPQQKGQDITHEKRSHEGQQIFKSCIHRSRGSCYN